LKKIGRQIGRRYCNGISTGGAWNISGQTTVAMMESLSGKEFDVIG
jgi:hypothetical protein